MTLNANRARHNLQQFDFKPLFIEELGWDNYQANLTITGDDANYPLQAIAEKRGLVVFVHWATGEIPPANIRNKIERQVAQSYREHILIFVDGQRTRQTWLWVRREIGRPLARRTVEYRPQKHSGTLLIQKLQAIAFSLEEEEDLTLVDVTSRVRAAFNVERATKKFYDQFKKERNAFEKFVQGIPDVDMSKWYVSVMLNRLMFVYFIQRKGFLDGDRDYLRNRMRIMQARHGDDQFYSFYRYFLLRLFHEGLGEPHHEPELELLIGKVPYLNGGIFQLHEVEQHYPDIQISDDAFTRIFNFFDHYQWHLDDRPLRDDREINPDVLGYIFEKYINQKQMGAYYTKEDITEYISKNSILPFLFDEAQKECAIAFTGENSVWGLAQADPDRYIYEAVRKGVKLPLPDEIAVGIDDVSQRGAWNTPAPDEYGLPTEIWRETVARRQRYEDVWLKLAEGEVTSINDFITYNLDIQQFAQDVIENSEGPELLRAFWKAINRVSVLDPTCGSGAFLFAALNILQPLYEACLARMAAFVEDLGADDHPQKYSDFKRVLAQVAQHPNQTYYVLKSIVVNNLYGVDIMAEAVEIAKLRLFLKLVAQAETVEQIEPLPDIDFNIRAGNTLVGFTSKEEVAKAMQTTQAGQGRLVFGEDQAALARIEEKAGDVDRLFTHFREMQTTGDLHDFDAADFVETKKRLQERLRELETELNRYLAQQYGVNPDNKQAYQKWLTSHQPFHWFIEFYGILKQDGFDLIVGNPPYLQVTSRNVDYQIDIYESSSCRNLYTLVLERSLALLHEKSRLGLIIPVSFVSGGSLDAIRDVVWRKKPTLWLSNFANRPGQLFTGAQNRLTIVLSAFLPSYQQIYSTDYYRWDSQGGEREVLFSKLVYASIEDQARKFYGTFPKIGTNQGLSIFEKVENKKNLDSHTSRIGNHKIFWVRVPGYFCQFYTKPPMARPVNGGPPRIRGEVNTIAFQNEETQRIIHAVLNSSLYSLFYTFTSGGRHINPSDVKRFPLELKDFSSETRHSLFDLSVSLESCMNANTSQWRKSGLLIDSVDSKACKSILDDIDSELAKHYGFTEEELDFIINYDIKYRMGDDLFDDEEEDDE